MRDDEPIGVDAFSDEECGDLLREAYASGKATRRALGGRRRNPYRAAADAWDRGWDENPRPRIIGRP